MKNIEIGQNFLAFAHSSTLSHAIIFSIVFLINKLNLNFIQAVEAYHIIFQPHINTQHNTHTFMKIQQ